MERQDSPQQVVSMSKNKRNGKNKNKWNKRNVLHIKFKTSTSVLVNVYQYLIFLYGNLTFR